MSSSLSFSISSQRCPLKYCQRVHQPFVFLRQHLSEYCAPSTANSSPPEALPHGCSSSSPNETGFTCSFFRSFWAQPFPPLKQHELHSMHLPRTMPTTQGLDVSCRPEHPVLCCTSLVTVRKKGSRQLRHRNCGGSFRIRAQEKGLLGGRHTDVNFGVHLAFMATNATHVENQVFWLRQVESYPKESSTHLPPLGRTVKTPNTFEYFGVLSTMDAQTERCKPGLECAQVKRHSCTTAGSGCKLQWSRGLVFCNQRYHYEFPRTSSRCVRRVSLYFARRLL